MALDMAMGAAVEGSEATSVVGTGTATRGIGPDQETGALLSAIEVIASFVSRFEPARYSGDDAASLVSSFAKGARLCEAGTTLAAARVVESHRHLREGHRSGPEWLSSITGESVGSATELLQLGGGLERHPHVEEALRSGRLSPSRAALVHGATKVNPASERELLAGAGRDTFRQFRDRCLKAKAQGRSRDDADKVHEAIHRARRVRHWTDFGTEAWKLEATLTPRAGASLLASLEAESNRFFEQARKNGVQEPPEAYMADALVALVTGRGIIGVEGARRLRRSTGGSTSGSRNESTSPEGSSDAEPTNEYPSGAEGSNAEGSDTAQEVRERAPDPNARVFVRVDLEALRRGSLGNGEICEIPGVGPVSVQTARDLMGDAITDLVITNGVDVTTICRLGRYIPTPLKTAVMERDQCCVVPGCDVRKGLEIDHWIIGYAQHGPVSLENLARLCHHHHQLRTHHGFQLHGGPGQWEWLPPASPKQPKRQSPSKRQTRSKNAIPPPKGRSPDPEAIADPPLFTIEA